MCNDIWILDTGATTHMSCRNYWLTNMNNNTSKVHLPNGDCSILKVVGDYGVFEIKTLSNVLYLPDFKYNLMFVGKLTKELSFFDTFFS